MLDIEEQNERNKPLQQFKSVFNMGRGAVYIIIAYFVYTTPGVSYRFGKTNVKIFCLLTLVYGIFRVYRSLVEYKQTLKK